MSESDSSNSSRFINHAENVKSWSLPSLGEKGKVVKSAKKEQQKKTAQGNHEIIEDYKNKAKPKPLTAEALQAISESAKKDGYDTGYQEGLTKGLKDGNAQGLKQGKEQAFNQYKQQLESEYARIKSIADTLLDPMVSQTAKLEDVVMDIALGIAKSILHEEIQCNPEKLYNVIINVLDALPVGANNIAVYLNQNDSELIEAIMPSASRNWMIKVDNTLSDGGCKIETQESFLDYSVEQRLQNYINECNESDELNTLPDTPVPNYAEQYRDVTAVKNEVDDFSKEEHEANASGSVHPSDTRVVDNDNLPEN